MDDPGPAYFEAEPHHGHRLAFTAPDPRRPGRRWTLLGFRTFQFEKLLATAAWLGERQHLWRGWRLIAEESGGAALAAHLAALSRADGNARPDDGIVPLERWNSTRVELAEDRQSIPLVLSLGSRSVELVRYRLADEDATVRFLSGLIVGGDDTDLTRLALVALLRGRNAVAGELDALAARFRDPTLRARDHTIH